MISAAKYIARAYIQIPYIRNIIIPLSAIINNSNQTHQHLHSSRQSIWISAAIDIDVDIKPHTTHSVIN